jgi:heat shock protein HslJ
MRTRWIAALAALTLIVAACAEGTGSGGTLEGTDWVLRSYDQDGSLTIVPDHLYADAEFAAQRVRGFSGCNEFDALYRSGGRTLFISQAAVTLMACDEETMAFEGAVLAALDSSRFYTARRNTLTVFGPGRTELLVYDAAPRNPVRGTWQVTAFASGNAVTSPLAGTEIDVTFGIASVGGFSGCNSFSGTYGTNGNVVRISRLATTRIACEQEVMDQETAFLEALQGAALIETRGPSLNLTDLRGSILVALARPQLEPGASPAPSGEPSDAPTAEPTEEPEETATPAPTPTPTPTPAPSPTATPVPSLPIPSLPIPSGPPIVVPETATCDLATADGLRVAQIVYAASWSTVTEPPDLACRYFDPGEITVPDDPAALVTAVMASTSDTAYAESVTAATDAEAWDVRQTLELTVDGLPATLVEATATADGAGVPTGTARFMVLLDVGAGGTLMLFTTAATVDEAYATNAGIVVLMTAASTFAAPPG